MRCWRCWWHCWRCCWRAEYAVPWWRRGSVGSADSGEGSGSGGGGGERGGILVAAGGGGGGASAESIALDGCDYHLPTLKALDVTTFRWVHASVGEYLCGRYLGDHPDRLRLLQESRSEIEQIEQFLNKPSHKNLIAVAPAKLLAALTLDSGKINLDKAGCANIAEMLKRNGAPPLREGGPGMPTIDLSGCRSMGFDGAKLIFGALTNNRMVKALKINGGGKLRAATRAGGTIATSGESLGRS